MKIIIFIISIGVLLGGCRVNEPKEQIVGRGMEYLAGDFEKDSVITYSTFVIIQKGDERYRVTTGEINLRTVDVVDSCHVDSIKIDTIDSTCYRVYADTIKTSQ